MKLIENCIPVEQQEYYLNLSKHVNWMYNKSTYHPEHNQVENDNTFDVGQLTCAVNPSDYFIFDPILSNLNMDFSIVRIKYNMLWKCIQRGNRHNMIHEDAPSGHLSAVYYVNDSDGDTIILDGNNSRVTPKKGSLLIFPSDLKHASSNPVDSYERVVINFIVKPTL
jgi:hypothetical protein